MLASRHQSKCRKFGHVTRAISTLKASSNQNGLHVRQNSRRPSATTERTVTAIQRQIPKGPVFEEELVATVEVLEVGMPGVNAHRSYYAGCALSVRVAARPEIAIACLQYNIPFGPERDL